MAGFFAQAAGTELILSSRLDAESDFALGVLLFNISNNLFYVVRQETSNGGYGDIKLFEKTGGDKYSLYGFLVGHAVISALRMGNVDSPVVPGLFVGEDAIFFGFKIRY